MKTNQFITLTLALTSAFLSTMVKAQENEVSQAEGAQFTLAYPLGTNGVGAVEKANRFSLNLLYGVNGGLNGLELGGLANYNNGDVNGVQLAGMTNINRGTINGLMWSGALNLTIGDARGAQISDVNVAVGYFKGFQGGVINYAGRLRGVQVGLINIVGEDNGALPIGLINVVKGGYYALEISTSEILHTQLNYKMGVEHFYTIFKLGSSRYENDPVYSVGLGFGSMFSLAEKHKIAMDLSFSNIAFDEEWNADENFLTRLDFSYRYRLGEHLSLFAGPSLNLYSSDMSQENGAHKMRIPSHATSFTSGGYRNWAWFGFNAGIAFVF